MILLLLLLLPGGFAEPADPAGASTPCPGIDAAQVFPFDPPAVSSDGSFVAFTTAAKLDPEDTNGALDVYVWDAVTGDYERISVDEHGAGSSAPSRSPAITPDGRFVAFVSGSDLTGAGDGSIPQVYVRDRQEDTVEIVSLNNEGVPSSGEASTPRISDDGRFVAFSSTGDNLVPGDTNGWVDVFVRDRQEDETVRASVNSDGEQGSGRSGSRSIGIDLSGGGRYVAIGASANNLSPEASGNWDVFVHDLVTRETEQVSVSSQGEQGSGTVDAVSLFPSISADGRFVAFVSSALNFDDLDRFPPQVDFTATQVFVRDRLLGTTELVSYGHDGSAPDAPSYAPAISADGRFVTFASLASNLVMGEDNGERDVYLHDRETGNTTRLSERPDGSIAQPGGTWSWGSFSATIGASGEAGAFVSAAKGLGDGADNGAFDVYVWGVDEGLVRLATPCVEPDLETDDGSLAAGETKDEEGGLHWLLFLLALPLVTIGLARASPRRTLLPVLLVVLLVGVSLIPATAHHHSPIQPGAPLTGTLNFVFEDETGDLYIGSCAHCLRIGSDGPIGIRVAAPGIGEFGTTVYSHYDWFGAHKQDFVLIKVDDDKHHLVDPSVRGWGGPTGIQDEFIPGTPTLAHGYGMGVSTTEPTRSQVGILSTVDINGPWKGWYFDDRIVAGGNSGSPMLTADGKALGTIIIVAAAVAQPGINGGPTASYILAGLRAAGYDLDLVTAPFPADPTQTALHCAEKPVDDTDTGEGCVQEDV